MARPNDNKPTLESHKPGPNGGLVPRCQFVRHGKHPKAGLQCKASAIRGANCCRTHGGNNSKAIGPLNSNWKGGVSATPSRPGRWTSVLAGPLQASYIAALKDPDLLSLESEIALVDVRMEDLVSRANFKADWPAMKDAYESLLAGMSKSDSAMIRNSMETMRDLLYGVENADKQWKAVVELAEQRKSLAESERKRMMEQNMFLSRDQAHAHARALLEVVTRHIKDDETLNAVIADFAAVMEIGRRLPPTVLP